MSYRFEFAPKDRILRCSFNGRVTDESLHEYYEQVGKYVARTKPRAGILDLSNITSFDASLETIRSMARSLPAMVDVSLPRFIVAPAAHVFGIARMFQALGEDSRPGLQVFRKLDEAYAALGVTDPQFEPVEPIE
ncbi:MAG: hypothetical protein WB780_17690 [Candidatus Acidiferrales bacterium]